MPGDLRAKRCGMARSVGWADGVTIYDETCRMTKIGPDTVIARGTKHVETRMGDETVMMSIEQGKYFAVGSTAQRIWECLAQPTTITAIVDRLIDEYEIERTQCMSEVTVFVAHLMDNGLTVECRA